MRRTRTTSQPGYTIIELMLVVAIVGVLAALTIPNLSSWIGTMRIKQGSLHLKSTIENTRKLAMSSGSRHCLKIVTDGDYADGEDDAWLMTVEIQIEDSTNSQTWTTITAPPELAGWTNNEVTRRHKGITLEGGADTTIWGFYQGCDGLLFNTFGFMSNPVTAYQEPCGGQNCARMTLRNKSAMGPVEQRTLWIDRGGNVRLTQGPTAPPVIGAI
jgi:prepilin-type N-terminal cleavage/methylation domain-containing protein